jgi:hypothetical protein
MAQPSWRLMPRTALGACTVGLVAAMAILFFLGSSLSGSLYRSVAAGDSILTDIAARPALALAMLAGMGAGLSAFIVGLVAIVKRKDNTLLVYLSTAIGGLLMVFLAGEVAFPH